MKKALSLLLVLLMLLSLCACGDSGSSSGSDENLGVYEIKKAVKDDFSVDVDDLFEDGFSIELKAKGKCKMNIDGQEGSGKWTLDGKKIEISGSGVEFSGTLKKGIMTLKDIEGSGVDVILVLEGVDYEDDDAKEADTKEDVKSDDNSGSTAAAETTASAAAEGSYAFTAIGSDGDGVLNLDAMSVIFGEYIDISEYEDGCIVLNSDGTGKLTFFGEESELTWDEEKITVDDDPADYFIEGNDLIITTDGTFLVFTKEGKKSTFDAEAYFNEIGYTWDDEVYDYVVNGVTPTTGTTSPSGGDSGLPVTLEEYVVVDNDYCVIKITGYNPNGSWGEEINVYLENKTSDKTLTFSASYGAVNGVTTDASLYEDVSAGKKANKTISIWDAEELHELGIEYFSEIEIGLCVRNSDNYSDAPVFEGSATIYPYGKENASRFERVVSDDDLLLIDESGYSVSILDWNVDYWGDTELGVYVENNTDKVLYFTIDDESVNGYMIDCYWGIEVQPGKVAFKSISFDADDLKEIGVEDYTGIESFEATWRVIDDSSWTNLYKDAWEITFS